MPPKRIPYKIVEHGSKEYAENCPPMPKALAGMKTLKRCVIHPITGKYKIVTDGAARRGIIKSPKKSRRKSRKVSRRKSRRKSRKVSRKKSRRKSRKVSRKVSRKKSRRKSRKVSRRKSRKKSKKRSSAPSPTGWVRESRGLRPGGPPQTMRIYVRDMTGAIIGGGEYNVNTDIRAVREDLEHHGVSRYTATTGQLMYNGEIVSYAHSDKRIGSYAGRMGWQPNDNGVIMLDLMPSIIDILVNSINTHITNNHQQFISLISRRRPNGPENDRILNVANWRELCAPRVGYLFGIRGQGDNIPGMCVDIVASSLGTTHQQLLNDYDQGGLNAIREYHTRVDKICNSFRFRAMFRSQLTDNLEAQLRGTMRRPARGSPADLYP